MPATGRSTSVSSSPTTKVCGNLNCPKHRKIGSSDYQLDCDMCGKSYHSGCLGIDEREWVKISGLMTIRAVLTFTCDSCKADFGKMKTQLDRLEKEVAALREQSSVARPPTSPAPPLDMGQISGLVSAVVKDMLEAESKKHNLVVLSASEPPQGTGAACSDRARIISVCEKLSIDPGAVDDVYRDAPAGKDRVRIMKIHFRNGAARRAFLSGFRGVRGGIPGMDLAWVRPDLTYQQRQRDRELRQELMRRREAGESVKIQRGQIVQDRSVN